MPWYAILALFVLAYWIGFYHGRAVQWFRDLRGTHLQVRKF